MHKPHTAFVFAGGGSLGAVEVGMLRALLEDDVRPDVVVGASAGAINAAFFALNAHGEGISELTQLWAQCSRQDIFPMSLVHAVGNLLGWSESLLKRDGLQRLLMQHFGSHTFRDTTIACHIVATDVQNGRAVVLSEGSLCDAVLASTAIPVIFPPVPSQSGLLMDGGVASNTPIATAHALGAARIIVLPTGFPCALRTIPRKPAATLLHTLALLIARQLADDAVLSARDTEVKIVPPLCPQPVSAYDFSQSATLIDQAYHQTRAWLDAGGLSAALQTAFLRAHDHPESQSHPLGTLSGPPVLQ